ncbi:hypothetical protein C2G38_2263742 [Gigaspora rosea]|uniref:Uncharacterized protein n=1 Tax=Gigaspora rosea TaxID=44941 RepID=A0A397UPP8_9GLOM|nr:hypothetical protein C2G38_2263742 [Gigaspora rosea]
MQAQRDSSINSSEIDILRQQISELRKENDSLTDENTKTAKENAELKRSKILDIQNFSIIYPSNPKSLEEIEIDNSLDLESKKEVSNRMKKKNREKKLLRGNEAPASQTQESHNTSSTMPTPLIPPKVSISDGDNSSEVLLQSNGTNVPESLDSKTVKELWDQKQNKTSQHQCTLLLR